jgi:tetratricopeptide (TPR) repeat protein
MRTIPALIPAVIGFLQAGHVHGITERVYLQKAESALKNKSYDQVILNTTKAIEANPNSEKAYAWRGYAYVEKRLYSQAVADCTRAIQLKQIDTTLWPTLAERPPT